mgnify:CR=1 FL=1
MYNNLKHDEITVPRSNDLISKLENVMGNSPYRIDLYEKYIVMNLKSKNWFTCNPKINPNLVMLDTNQFEYILDLYQVGIALNSDVIQNFLIQCKGE